MISIEDEDEKFSRQESTVPSDLTHDSSMAMSVTRHAQKSQPASWSFLLAGIDTLDLGVYVNWDDQWRHTRLRFDNWKGKAREMGASGGLLMTDLPIGGVIMLPNGRPPMYRFHLQIPEGHIFIGQSDTFKEGPNVYVSLTAKTLWQKGVSQAVSFIDALLSDLGGGVVKVQPSRVDLCVYFHIPGGLSLDFLRDHHVSRSRGSKTIEVGQRLETYYFGTGKAPVLARIYDKGREILKSDKAWFLPLWKRADGTDVWRVEFQFRRTALKAFGINHVENLLQQTGSLWQRLTDLWLSFRLHDNDQTTRRTIHPWWASVAACAPQFGVPVEIERLEFPPSAKAEYFEKHVAASLSSYGAVIKCDDFITVCRTMVRRLMEMVDRDEFRRKVAYKSIQRGNQPPSESTGEKGDRHV